MTKLKLWEKKTEKLKMWQLKLWQSLNSNGDNFKNSNCDKTQKLKLCQKLKLWWNSNWDETQELKKWKKLKYEEKTQTQNVTKLKLWQNLKTKIMTTQYLDIEKTQKLKLWQNLKYDKFQFMKEKNFKIVF